MSTSEKCYGIRAECRDTKKRVIIERGMSQQEAEEWRPDSYTKKAYRYFRVVNVNNYIAEGGA